MCLSEPQQLQIARKVMSLFVILFSSSNFENCSPAVEAATTIFFWYKSEWFALVFAYNTFYIPLDCEIESNSLIDYSRNACVVDA